ncbi:MAG: FtsX-like permease family protein [Synechococcales cyanobacterium RM1_1_8]|nr:FtsX-like permease family protein [Synechococcales cyanobacterium RM1_1_8]
MVKSVLNALNIYWQARKPLAWAQLTHRKARLLAAMLGVAFANILIFTQLGLRAMLFEGVTLVPDHLRGDLFLVSAYAPNIDLGSFPRTFLYQADAVEGVASASPLYIGFADWVNPLDLNRPSPSADSPQSSFELFPTSVKVLAFNPTQPVLNIPAVNQQIDRLTAPGAVLYDRLGQEKLGPIPSLFRQQGGVSTLMNNRRVYVVGLFSLGSTLFDNGHVAMGDWTYAQWYGANFLEQVTVGCLTLEPGVDLEAARSRLQATLSPGVRVLTQVELAAAEQAFRASLPNGKVLNFGALMGFIVGLVIVYQVLYTDVSDHLPEYATLKAMGYSDSVLLRVILQEALILAVLGFIPGYCASYGVYYLLANITRIPLTMKTTVALQVFILTLVMCGISGAIAVHKLRSADPADVF